MLFAGDKKKRKADENNDFGFLLFYSKTTGANPASKDCG